MFVAKRKPIEEIIEEAQGYEKILMVGCNECVTVCEAGGKKEVAVLASALRMHFMNQGKDVKIDEVTLERQCDHEYLEELRNSIDRYDAVISLACGVGVQFMAEKYMITPILPGVDTCFMGVTEGKGRVVRALPGVRSLHAGPRPGASVRFPAAPNGFFNGPCGGSTDGHCEIDKNLICGWQLIVERLTKLGRLDDYEILVPIKDWSTERAGGPRKVVREDLMQ